MSCTCYTSLVRNTHLWLNGYHAPWLDTFMRIYTGFGEDKAWMLACIVFFIVWLRREFTLPRREALLRAAQPLLALVLATLIVQPIKYLVAAPRPLAFFETYYPDITLPLVQGVHLHRSLSFPSGHTATFFALACSLIALFGWLRTRTHMRSSIYYTLCVVFIFFAALGGYSRIYLSQHFLHDVLAGALVGVVARALSGLILGHFAKSTLQNNP